MKKPIIRSAVRSGGFLVEQKLSVPMVFSFIGHLIFCLLFILLPKISLESTRPTRYINVQLMQVSAPLPAAAPAAAPVAALPEAVPETSSPPKVEEKPPVSTSTPATTKTTKDAVSLSSEKTEKKQSMKKKTIKREQVMDSAIKNIEREVVSSQEDQRQQALDRIRNEVKEQEAQAVTEISSVSGENGRIGEEGGTDSEIKRIYYAEVAYQIKKNWAFSDQMAGGENGLYNAVVIKISRSGNIEEIWFDQRSDNTYFDESTRKAILKSSPLPKIPDEISGPSLTMGFRFNPNGLD